MKTLWWVRHGPTNLKTMVGWSDVPADLSDSAAIARLDAFLPRAPVVSSDLIRAVHTADAIQRDRPRLPHDAGLRELNFGDWEMREAQEIYAENPDLAMAYWNDPETSQPPGGESWADLSARVNGAVDRLLGDTADHLIIVAHFGAILSQLRRALDVSVKDVMRHRIENLSVTEIRLANDRWRAGQINHRP